MCGGWCQVDAATAQDTANAADPRYLSEQHHIINYHNAQNIKVHKVMSGRP